MLFLFYKYKSVEWFFKQNKYFVWNLRKKAQLSLNSCLLLLTYKNYYIIYYLCFLIEQ